MKNEASGMWKKAIFVLALIIAIISLCNSVSATKLTQLTTNETDEYDPAWSPDGNKIAYVGIETTSRGSPHTYNISVIWVMDSDGKNKKVETENPMSIEFLLKGILSPPSHPTWSLDGSEIAFAYRGDICVVGPYPDPNVSRHTASLTYESEHEYWDPAWSPDGIQIAFASYRSGNKAIGLMFADRSNKMQQEILLTTHKSIDEHPAWSPDASKIAFTSYRSGNADIWVMDRDGSNLKQLTTDKSKDFYPAWSSDGTKIAFVSDRSGNRDIWVMSSDGTNVMQLTTDESNDESPTWWSMSSQEEMKIAFTSERAGNKDIWVMEFSEDELSKGEGVEQSKILVVIKRYLPFISAAAILVSALLFIPKFRGFVFSGLYIVFSGFQRIILGYYRRKMRKWEREGYDVSKLKEVLEDEE